MSDDMHAGLMQQLLQTFREEAEDYLQVINSKLLQYERAEGAEAQQEAIQTAFRAAHSLKGAARAVSMHEVQKLAHAVETVFQRVRDQHHTLTSIETDRLYDALDLFKAHLSGETPSVSELAEQLFVMGGQSPQNGADASAPVGPTSSTGQITPTEAPSETIRVSLRKLDDLMAEVGEMLVMRISASAREAEVIAINHLLETWDKTFADIKTVLQRQNLTSLLEMYTAHADTMQAVVEAFAHLERGSRRDSARLGMLTDSLQDKVRRLRMVPFQSQALPLERVVRDTARQTSKSVRFELVGGQIELDKKVLETLRAPLVHLLSNAVVHGIELPDARVAAGKPAEGCVRVQVQQRGGEIWIHVSDDGQGFDAERISAAYQARYGELPSNESTVRLAFAHGVTTHEQVDELSGRGVGLDVVGVSVASLHGRVNVATTTGQGTTVTLSVPTSLAITRTLLVSMADETYALPLLAIEKIVPVTQVQVIRGRAALRLEQRTIPFVSLGHLLRRPNAASPHQNGLALIMAVADHTIAVHVDDVLTEQELAIKPLTYPIKNIPLVSGVAVLGSGKPVIVLNPGAFLSAYHQREPDVEMLPKPMNAPAKAAAVVMVVDDSITTRTLERNILEAAGYVVVTATDGVEALNRLQEHPVQIVISDIEMPNVNGFALTRALRADTRYQDLPVVLVTSLERDEDRHEGMLSGANAYIVKRGFDQQELLNVIAQLL